MRQVIGILTFALPVLFNLFFARLSKKFDYPAILRKPTGIVLHSFQEGGIQLIVLWWSFAATAIAFAPISAALTTQLGDSGALATVTIVFGVMAGLVQFLGLIRWPFLVPHLARELVGASDSKKESIDLIFQSANRYLGVAVGEHLGYLFTGLWTASLSISLLSSSGLEIAFGLSGIFIGLVLAVCAFEFVGRNELYGWRFAGLITPFAYIAWSIWLAGLGLKVLLG